MGDAVGEWLSRFDAALAAGDVGAATDLFEPDGYWRDLLTFTWNIATMEGRRAIAAMLGDCLAAHGALGMATHQRSGRDGGRPRRLDRLRDRRGPRHRPGHDTRRALPCPPDRDGRPQGS